MGSNLFACFLLFMCSIHPLLTFKSVIVISYTMPLPVIQLYIYIVHTYDFFVAIDEINTSFPMNEKTQ